MNDQSQPMQAGMPPQQDAGKQPASTNMYGVDPNGSAGANYEAMTRAQWQQYVSTFVPIENDLIKYATDSNTVTNNVNTAVGNVDQAFQAQQGMTARRMQGYGIQQTPEQKAASDRETALQHSLGDVQAANTARRQTIDLQQQAMLGRPAPSMGGGQGGG